MIGKLRRRFILIAMASVFAVMLILGLSINLVNFINVNNSLEEMLQMIRDNQGVVPDFPMDGIKDGKAMNSMSTFTPESPYSTRYFVLLYQADGSLLTADMRHIAAVDEDDISIFLELAHSHGTGSGYTSHYKFYISANEDGSYMAVFLDCHQELYAVRMFALATALVILVCLILIYALVLFFSKRAIDPVVKSMARQKQFITDASHELKTPLTVMTTSLKVLEMDVGQQKWIDKAQAQADQMRDLVNNLVTLSRLDEEKPSLQMADFDLSEALEETADSFQDFAEARGKTLVTELPAGVVYHGDQYAVRQLVSILLDNAIKYALPGGEIRLQMVPARKGVVLYTSNPCADVPQEELPRLFDRFYRLEKSRSKQTGGFGVGLSIARGIAEAHKGSIRAELPEPGSIRFIVTLK